MATEDSASALTGTGPAPSGLSRSASQAEPLVPDADGTAEFKAVQKGVRRLMELDREAGGDLSVAIGRLRAIDVSIGRNHVAPIWRRGVGDAISAVDVIVREWRKSRLRSRRDAAAEIDPLLQVIHDARMLRKPGSYYEAGEAGDVLRAQAIEARRAETQSGSVHESAVPEGNAP